MKGTIIKCDKCGTLNRVLFEKISLNPRCGRCNNLLKFLDKPVEIDYRRFYDEVETYNGFVLLDLWSPT